MSTGPIETGVVLTTDNSQYDRSMQSSAGVTDSLGTSVDQLGAKIDQLSKRAGKKLFAVAAADVATITAATVAYSAFERQMTSLNAQAAVLNRTWDAGQMQAQKYAKNVNELRAGFGTATRDATALVQTISKMTDHTTSITALTTNFTKMANATQESATGLAASQLQLQKTMGTAQKDTRAYSNSLTTLAAGANTSATAIADFANQIAPVGRLVGQSQADIQGVSTAFIKAGQDGFRAATVYNKVLTDISYATQTGSPEMAKYANFVGMTVDSFKGLSGTDKILNFFERVNQLGPDAITSLNRMGLDGANTVKTITALTQQTGGLRANVMKSRAAMNDPSVERGNAAAMQGLVDDLGKLRSELNMTAEAFGEKFAPAAQAFVKGMTEMAHAARVASEGPLGDLAAVLAAVVAPLAALGGAGAMALPLLAKLGSAALIARGSGTRGLVEGYRGAPTVTDGVAKMNQGTTGMQVAANGSWFQRYQYNAGNRMGAAIGGAAELGRTGGFFGAPGREPLWQRGAAAGMNASAFMMRNVGAGAFAPMGFAGWNDPTSRPRFFNDSRNPLQQARDAYRERTTGRTSATSPGRMGMDRGVSLFDSDVRVTDEGRVTSSAATTAMAAGAAQRTAVTREATAMSAAFANATRAAGSMAGALASAAGNTAFLGGKAAMGVGKYMAGNSSMLGIGALMAGSAMGMNSNAFTFGSTGLMVGGGMGGLLGVGAGIGMDVYQQNKSFNQAQATYADSLKHGNLVEQYQSGQGISAQVDQMDRSTSGKSGWTAGIPVVGTYMQGSSISSMYSKSKYGLEGLLTGENPITERLDAEEKVQKNQANTQGAFSAIASRQGFPIDNWTNDQAGWEKLDAVLTSITPQMEKLGITSEDITSTWAEAGKSGDNTAWVALMNQLANPEQFTGLNDRIARLGQVGTSFTSDTNISQAIAQPENMNAQFKAVNSFYTGLSDKGLSAAQIMEQMGNIRSTVGDESDPSYQLASGVQQQALRQLNFQMPFMSRTQQFGAQANMFSAQRNVMEGDPNQQANMQAAEDSFMASANSMGEYFKGLLLQQREFAISQARSQEDFATTRERMDEQYNISRGRAQEDFNIQRNQQEEDYHLSRMRANTDFEVAQKRTTDNYNRSMQRGQFDFNLSRRRQEVDYQHQVEVMVEQSAKSMYNIYDRVKVEQSSSANFLLFNGQDQLRRIQQQSKDLGKLRGAGVSDDVIQQLGLTDSANAQQLSRFVAEIANNPQLVSQFNKQVQQRLKAAGSLTTDESSKEWEEFQRQYKVARTRASEDFQRQVERSHKDFRRQMSQMDQDFEKSMNRQATDYETAQERQQEAFSKSMKRGATDYGIAVDNMTEDFGKAMNRAKADMDRMAEEISGSLEDILVRSTNKLGGTAAKQARIVLGALRDLDTDATKKGIQLMNHMGQIFGFNTVNVSRGEQGVNGSGQGQKDAPGMAEGGVLPGYTPGRDVHTFTSKTGGTIRLSGGEAIMVPEWVDKNGGPNAVARMNAEARGGGAQMHTDGCKGCFANGGVVNPSEPVTVNGMQISRIAAAQAQLAKQMFGINWYLMQGGFGGNHIEASGASHDYPGVGDFGPGSIPMETGFRKVGFAAWARNIPGRSTVGSGAHVHAISLLDPGDASSPQVYGSWPAHKDGLSGGPGSDPAPHVPWVSNLEKRLEKIAGTMNLAALGGGGGTGTVVNAAMLEDILQKRYPKVEQDAARVTMGGGLFEDGYWSRNINRGARYAFNKQTGMGSVPKDSNWFSTGGIFTGAQTVNVGEHGPEMLTPLNGTGINFLTDLFRRVSVGEDSKATNVRHSQTSVGHTGATTYQIDRSTTFTGPITVQADNPNEMITKLRARQRVQAMAQASLGGVRG